MPSWLRRQPDFYSRRDYWMLIYASYQMVFGLCMSLILFNCCQALRLFNDPSKVTTWNSTNIIHYTCNKTFSYYQGGLYLELFHSFVPFNNGHQVVYNHLSKSEASTTDRDSTFIETEVHVSSTLEREDEMRSRIGKKQQSDPRAFGWNSSLYCFTRKVNWRGRRGKGRGRAESLDFENSLINLITGMQYSLDHWWAFELVEIGNASSRITNVLRN